MLRSGWLALGLAASLLLVGTAAGSASSSAGGAWQVVPSANPHAGQVTNSDFSGVSMRSATDGWTVGQFMDAQALGHPLTEHWDGSRWSRVTAPEGQLLALPRGQSPPVLRSRNTAIHGNGRRNLAW